MTLILHWTSLFLSVPDKDCYSRFEPLWRANRPGYRIRNLIKRINVLRLSQRTGQLRIFGFTHRDAAVRVFVEKSSFAGSSTNLMLPQSTLRIRFVNWIDSKQELGDVRIRLDFWYKSTTISLFFLHVSGVSQQSFAALAITGFPLFKQITRLTSLASLAFSMCNSANRNQ